MTHVTCRLTAKNRDQLWNPTLGCRVWATFTFLEQDILRAALHSAKMQPLATDAAWVCLLVTTVSPTKMAELIVMPFGFCTRVGPRKRVSWGPGSPPVEGAILGVVPPLKCIRLCKQQTSQQHGATDLCAGTVHLGKSTASEWALPLQGWQVQRRYGFCQNSVIVIFLPLLTVFAVCCQIQGSVSGARLAMLASWHCLAVRCHLLHISSRWSSNQVSNCLILCLITALDHTVLYFVLVCLSGLFSLLTLALTRTVFL